MKLLLTRHAQRWPELPIGSWSLFWAAYGGYDEVVKMLITASVAIDSDLPPYDGLTTLAVAVMNNHKSTVKLLLNSGINVHINAKDNYG